MYVIAALSVVVVVVECQDKSEKVRPYENAKKHWKWLIQCDIGMWFANETGSGLFVTSFAMVTCMASWLWCSRTVNWIMGKQRGTHDMQVIADYIKEGSDSYLRTQYKYIASIALITAVGLVFIYMFRGSMSGQISTLSLAIVTAVSFLIGAFCSALAGYTGVSTSVRCNLRVAAAAAQYDYKNSFLLAFRAGAVSAVLSASMCILV